MRWHSTPILLFALVATTLAPSVVGQGPTWASLVDHPTSRSGHAMAFDTGRGRTVVFGGSNAGSALGETWEWDGRVWIRRNPLHSPSPRTLAAMAYDPVRGITVLFGGFNGITGFQETWEWDGDDWRQLSPLISPPGAAGHVMTYHGGTNPGILLVSSSGTWQYDGTTWTFRGTAPSPYGGMAYATSRQRTYLLGNAGISSAPPTYAWNGTSWSTVTNFGNIPGGSALLYDPQRDALIAVGGSLWNGVFSTTTAQTSFGAFSAAVPGSLSWSVGAQFPGFVTSYAQGAVAYDNVRNTPVLFGGVAADFGAQQTWNRLYELPSSGSTWLQRSPTAPLQPTSRIYSDMAFEASTGRMVVCAGQGQSSALNDTWTFDGSAWTNHGASATVSPRTQPALGYFPGVGTVLFGGGIYPTTYRNDTYVLAGAQWQVPNVVGAPPARMGHDMVYGWNRLVMFGGYNGTALADTWSLNQNFAGLSWLPMLTIGSPGARQSHAMAFDERRNCLVVFGGADANGQFLGDTWELTPAAFGWQWTQRTTTNAPPRRWQHKMAYDPARGVVVLTGGYGNPQCGQFCASHLNDVWEYDGTDWTQRLPSTFLPPVREGAGFAYDSQRQRFVMQGGSGSTPFPGDTWFYSAPNDRFGEGMQGGSSLRLRCTRFPVAGEPTGFAFDSPLGFGWLTVFVGPAPQAGLTLGPGLLCGTGTFYGVPATVVDAMGFPGSVSFQLPASMIGQGFVTQGIALDTGFCLRLTDPLAVTIHAP
jgi:hypothetical protein